MPDKVRKAAVAAAAVPDETALIITTGAATGCPTRTCATRRTSRCPRGGSTSTRDRFTALLNAAEAHLKAEILPYAEDAWIDHGKTKVGVEIPFTRHFYEYVRPRPLAEIEAELLATETPLREPLAGLVRWQRCSPDALGIEETRTPRAL